MHAWGIVGIFYVRIYPDGTIINLANNADWTDFYFKQIAIGHYQSQDIVDQCFTYSGASLWAFNEANPIWQDAKHYFGYSSGVSICENHANFREVIGFYSAKNDQIMNHFYVNQMDTLKKLKQYFMMKAQELISETEQERQTSCHQVYPQIDFVPEPIDTKGMLFSKEVTLTLIHKNTGLPINLPPQRGKCLSNLLQGQSSQEIASNMQLSPKTIEHYLEMLRKELGCRSSRELILHYAHQITYTRLIRS